MTKYYQQSKFRIKRRKLDFSLCSTVANTASAAMRARMLEPERREAYVTAGRQTESPRPSLKIELASSAYNL